MRIIYIHVPAAWLGMAGWAGIAVASLMQLVWRHPLAAVAARAVRGAGRGLRRHLPGHRLALGPADLGHLLGMGRADDLDAGPALPLPRLYRAGAAPRREQGGEGRIAAIFGLVGAVNLPIIHYSVLWWRTLHQGQSIDFLRGTSTIDGSMLWPLLVVGARLHPAVRRDRADADARRARPQQGRGAAAADGGGMNPWPFVIAAYAIALGGTLALIAVELARACAGPRRDADALEAPSR